MAHAAKKADGTHCKRHRKKQVNQEDTDEGLPWFFEILK